MIQEPRRIPTALGKASWLSPEPQVGSEDSAHILKEQSRDSNCLTDTQHQEFAAQQLGFKCRSRSHCQTTA